MVMKHLYKHILLILAVFPFTSCEINDEILERSDSSIYNKLEGDRTNSGTTVTPSGPNHIVGDKNYDSGCYISIAKECTLADTYACRLLAGGYTTGYRTYASHKSLTVKEALSYLNGNREVAIEDSDIVQGGLDNVEKYLYILPCNGDKYGDIVILSLPAKSTDGFDGTVSIAKTTYSSPYNEITFSPTSYAFEYGLYTFSDESYRNDAFLALLLETDGVKMDPLAEATTVLVYNPDHNKGTIVTRAIDATGQLSNKVTKVTAY